MYVCSIALSLSEYVGLARTARLHAKILYRGVEVNNARWLIRTFHETGGKFKGP